MTPFVTLFIVMTAAEEHISGREWALDALKEIGLAAAVTSVAGIAGGKLLALARDRGWTSQVSEQIAIPALALLAYQGSVMSAGTGSSRASAAGFLCRAVTRGRHLAGHDPSKPYDI